MIQSDPDDSSESSDEKVIGDETIETRVPLSTSIVLEKLPSQDQLQLKKIIHEQETFKITIRFQPIGSTPAITPKVYKISSNQTISTINKFLTKRLKIKTKLIYLYIQNSFQPNPDERLGDLYELFKTNNELIINYCHTIAFG